MKRLKLQAALAAFREAHRQTNLALAASQMSANVSMAEGKSAETVAGDAMVPFAIFMDAILPPLIEHDLLSRLADGRTLRQSCRDVRALLDEKRVDAGIAFLARSSASGGTSVPPRGRKRTNTDRTSP